MTWEQFSEIFAMLALQLRATDADEPMARAYFKVLRDLEPELVAMAAQRFGKHGGSDGHWFPKTSEWREMAGKIEAERWTELKARLRRLPEPLCLVCGDTGFELDTASKRARRCACLELRRLEVLGRRQMPALLPAPEPNGDETKVQALVRQLAGRRSLL